MTARALYFDAPLSFADGVCIQEQLVRARAAGSIPDVVLFLEHDPVVTLGSRGRDRALRVSPEQLRALGIEFAHASRGGDVTYHGPGQLILYPILRLGGNEADAHGYLWNLEEIAIRTAVDFGVAARRRKGMNGTWADAGKIAAIGFRLTRWVTMHGMSFNVDVDLAGFETIIPCGLKGEPVSSLKAILGARCPPLTEVRDCMKTHFEAVCGRALQICAANALPADLAGVLRP
jgi:lipoyl(octanoyl) transferase